MEDDRGASGVEYMLLCVFAVVVIAGAATMFSSGLGGGGPTALGAQATPSTSGPAVLGRALVQGGGGDAAVWVDGGEPLVLTARPGDGLTLVDAGRLHLDSVSFPAVAGVDVRDAVVDAPGAGAIVVAGDGASLRAYRLDAGAFRLRPLGGPLPAGVEVAGLCLHRSPAGGELSVFAYDGEGRVVQSQLAETAGGALSARRLHSFDAGGGVGACAVDDVHQTLFLSEPGRGLWRYDLSGGDPAPLMVDRVGAGGGLVGDVDALAVVDTGAGGGWILASSESDEAFTFYRRGPVSVPSGRFPASERVDNCHDVTGLAVAGGFLACHGAASTDVVPLPRITRLPAP